MKRTLPAVTVAPDAATVAVNVTSCPKPAGLGEAATEVVVVAGEREVRDDRIVIGQPFRP